MSVEVVKVPYVYDGRVLRVVDGDTVDVEVSRTVDFGFNILVTQTHTLRLRLYGINAPEMRTPEGPPAREHLIDLMGDPLDHRLFQPVVVETVKDRTEKYGRYLATLKVDGINVNERMVADGHAVPYMV